MGERRVEERDTDRHAVEFSFRFGWMSVIAVAHPVDVGISEFNADRARQRSLCGPTMTWVLVTLWMVVMAPRSIPVFS